MYMAKKSSTSGAEANYTGPQMFPRRRGNCYSFALNKITQNQKLQPGELAGNHSGVNLSRGCSGLNKQLRKDAKASGGRMYPVQANKGCRKGYYKIASVMDPNTDFHFMRQMGSVVYKVKRGETLRSVATKFAVKPSQVVRRAPGVLLVRNAKVWAHKRGLAGGPIIEDSCGKPILDPRKACMNYGDLDYTKKCGAFCVLRGGFRRRS